MSSPSQTPIKHPQPKFISVILSTYNAPEWLEKSVWGYAMQQHREFELIIADDGSGDETAEMIEKLKSETGIRIKHVWHPDDGFQKCTILNLAIGEADGDYFVFSDGDCIPRKDFLSHHFYHARRGHFLSGGYYKLPMNLSRIISIEDIRSERAFRLLWLKRYGLPFSHRWMRLCSDPVSSRVFNALTTTKPTWNGNNASGWADDVRNAGGFDERMKYGGEDRELGERFENAGIRGKHVRYQTVCLHLDHSRGYVNEEDQRRNREIRSVTRQTQRTVTEHGLFKAA